MQREVYDYKNLRLTNITRPEYRHLLLILSWFGYFLAYYLTERFIPVENCYVVHCFIDDIIPFCELFIIPYVGWYFLIAWSLIYFLRYNVENFKALQKYIIITQVVATIIFIVAPSRQDLRPEVFPRDNILTYLVGLIYSADTNTGVCPSLHVAYSLGIASAWLKERTASNGVKIFVTIVVILICLSVAFVKQHSVVDIFAALPLGLFAEVIVFRKYYRKRFKKCC